MGPFKLEINAEKTGIISANIKTAARPSLSRNGFPLSRRFSVILSLFRVKCWFGRSDWKGIRVNNVGPRSVLASGLLFGGGFNHARKA